MKYIYSLPSSILVLMVLLALATLIIQIIITYISFVNRRNGIIKNIFNLSLVLYYAVILGVIASVLRHLTEHTFSFDYYLVIRYLTIPLIIIMMVEIIKNKSFINIVIALTGILVLPCFEYVFKNVYSYIFIICISYYFIYTLYCLLELLENLRKNVTVMSIKEALDSLPIGICLANKKNKIIFNNATMAKILKYNGIDSRIKVIDLWDEIKKKDEIFSDDNNAILKYEDDVFMVSLDKSNDIYQIKASSVKAEYEIIEEIIEANKILEKQESELKDYILKIEEVERQRSFLRIKGRIHDVFAQRLSIIHQYLDNEDIKNISTDEIKELLTSMTRDIKEENELLPEDIKANMISTYELIGMKINFIGEINKENENAILKIVREAATNALRHGGASELTVEANNNIVTITNNGQSPSVIKEGNGIKNMRFIANENKLTIELKLNPYRIIIK